MFHKLFEIRRKVFQQQSRNKVGFVINYSWLWLVYIIGRMCRYVCKWVTLPVVIFLFHETNLFLVLYLSPWKLSIGELYQHVEKGPQIVVTSLIDQCLNIIFWGETVTKMFPSNHFSPISLFLWALIEAYLTVPRKPAAARAGLTSPAALVYCRARPKSSM